DPDRPMNKELLLAHPWFAPCVAALIAVPLALLVHHVGGLVLRRLSRGAPVLHTMLVKIQPAARLVLRLIALQVVWQTAPGDLRCIDGVRHLNGLLLIATATWLAIRCVNGLADGVIAQHPSDIADNLRARRVLTQTRVLARTA